MRHVCEVNDPVMSLAVGINCLNIMKDIKAKGDFMNFDRFDFEEAIKAAWSGNDDIEIDRRR